MCVSLGGRELGSAPGPPDSPPQKGGRAGTWALGVGWLADSPVAPEAPLSPVPCLPLLVLFPSPQRAGGTWAVAPRGTRNTRGTLTSQGVLGHTEAQGLQPVVDVRFGHGKLEFCREQRVKWVTGVLRARRRRAQRPWLHLPGGGSAGPPWEGLGVTVRASTEGTSHSGSTNLRGHTHGVHCECGRLQANR